MAEKLLLKSRAVEIYDFRQVDISQFLTGFTVDEAQYQKDLERVLRRFGRREEAAFVSEGDTVTLTCASDLERYNKKHMPVQVGRGLLNAALEAAMIGMASGSEKTVSLDGHTVTLTVERIAHTVLPELTDENAASFGLEGVSSVAELRKYCIGKQVEMFLLEDENPDMASAFVWQEIAKHSRVIRDPQEAAAAEAKAEKKYAELTAISAEDDGEAIDIEMLRRMFLNEVDLAAIGQQMMEQEGVCLTEEDYARYIDKMAEAYPDKSRETLEHETSRLDFCLDRCGDYLAHQLDLYVASVFKAHFTKE